MISMWERMSHAEGGRGSSIDFMSTHPANAKRIKVSHLRPINHEETRAESQQLQEWLPQVGHTLYELTQAALRAALHSRVDSVHRTWTGRMGVAIRNNIADVLGTADPSGFAMRGDGHAV